MGVLGERDRDLAAADQALSALTARIDQTERRHASATAQLNQRLAVLRDNERQAAELARVVMHAGGQLARLEEAAAAAQANLLNQQTALAAAEVNLAEAERTLSHHGVEIARTTARLEEAQTRLASLEGQVDHTLLAKATGELSGRRDALTKEVAALDEEIEQKGPLAASATTLSTRVAELEDQLLRLTREREQAAAAVRDARHQLDLVQADRTVAEREHTRLTKQVNALDARKEETEGALASLSAEVRQQDSVFATLEVLKKEQGFLRELIGAMLDDGSTARERIRELRQESETLLAQQLELEKDLIGKQTEIQLLDKEIVAKNRSLEKGTGRQQRPLLLITGRATLPARSPTAGAIGLRLGAGSARPVSASAQTAARHAHRRCQCGGAGVAALGSDALEELPHRHRGQTADHSRRDNSAARSRTAPARSARPAGWSRPWRPGLSEVVARTACPAPHETGSAPP